MTDSHQLRVIVFRDVNLWVAQCLEHDIGAQAHDLDTLEARLGVALETELATSLEQHGAPFAGIDPAPEHFHEMWERRSGEFKPSHPSHIKNDVNLDMALCA
jgi:hypothetical protein